MSRIPCSVLALLPFFQHNVSQFESEETPPDDFSRIPEAKIARLCLKYNKISLCGITSCYDGGRRTVRDRTGRSRRTAGRAARAPPRGARTRSRASGSVPRCPRSAAPRCAGSSTTEITDTRAIASLLRTKDLIPSVVPSRIATSSCESRSPTPASAAAITSSVPEPSSRSTSGIRHSASGVTDSVRAYLPPGRATSTRLVGPEERVVQPPADG